MSGRVLELPTFIGPRAGEPVPHWSEARVVFAPLREDALLEDTVVYTEHKVGVPGAERAVRGYVLSSLSDDERTAVVWDALVALAGELG